MTTESPLTRKDLLSCMELGKALTSELEPRRLFSKIFQKISELLPSENWSLFLLDEETQELYFEVSAGLDVELVKDVRLRLGEGIAGKVALDQIPMIVPEVTNCAHFYDKVDNLTGDTTRSIVCVPLLFGGKTLGVIELVNPLTTDERTLPLLALMADYAAIAVENMRRYRRIEDLAVHDNLTGLYNTRYLYRTLEDLFEKAKETARPLSLIFMDIDNFKRVVDTFGHLMGSQTIQEVAGTIRQCLTDPSFAVAYGGDEFVAVLPGFSKTDALKKADEIRLMISKTPYLSTQGYNIHIRASLGIATYPDDASDVRGLLALADDAMFRVKGQGKDGVRSA